MPLINLDDLQHWPIPDEAPGDVDCGANDGQHAPPWENPTPLQSCAAPPPFPIDALPPTLAEFASAVALTLSVPADMPAMLTLGVVASVVQRACDVQVRPSWSEPSGLFVAIAYPPGIRKSSAFRLASRPIVRWEREQGTAMADEIAGAVARRKALEKALGKETDPDLAADLASQVEGCEVPTAPRVIADDATPEKLTDLLGKHPGIAAMVPEGCGLFDSIGGRYRTGSAPSYAVYLQGHAGDRIVVDRIGRPSICIDNPRLTIVTTTQPDALRHLAQIPGAKGYGLLARFLLLLPVNPMGTRAIRQPPPPTAVVQRYDALIRGLLDRMTLRDDGARHRLVFSPDADDLMAEFETELEPRLGPDGDLDAMNDWAGKLAGAIARIAGLLHIVTHAHVAEPWHAPITRATLQHAIAIGRYLLAHARVAFDAMGADPAMNGARLFWAKIDAKGWGTFTRRDMHDAVRGRQDYRASRSLDAPLDLLCEHGYIRRDMAGTPGPGRPSERYRRNPRA